MKARKLGIVKGDRAVKKGRVDKHARYELKPETLNWKSIPRPDYLEDVGGLLDFEEVEGVDVFQDGSGRASYSVTSKKGVADAKTSVKKRKRETATAEEDDEFTGFGDEPTVAPAKRSRIATDKVYTKPGTELVEPDGNATDADQGHGTFEHLEEDSLEGSGGVSAWRPLHLSPDTMASLSRLKFTKPTPIQRSAIPQILAGDDVVGKASTGSGKTLAFGIPILERYLELQATQSHQSSQVHRSPLALILSPTRELAHQLDKHLGALCSNGLFEGPLIATLTGGLSVQKQQRLLKNADIVIGTPGRLWEIASEGQGIIKALQQIEFLVIDEADRLLSEGHFKEVEEILNALDRKENGDEDIASDDREASAATPGRQTLVFSATFDRNLQRKLSGKFKPENSLLSNKESMEYLLSKINFRSDTPKFIDVDPVNQMARDLKEGMIECGGTEKDLYLYTLLLLQSNTRTLVFTNSISSVRRLTPFLQNLNLPALALHSGMPQKARMRSVEHFTQAKNGESSILVATDVAARGLDIPNVQLVIHYHLPRAADTYVHRSGRTARAGQQGSSILICAPEEVAGVRRLVAKIHANSAVASDKSASEAAKQGYYIRTLDLDRRIVSRLKPRATLAKQLADTNIAKETHHKEDDFMRAAAEELGVDYDSDEFEVEGAKGRRGRGSGRKKKEREARGLTKTEVGAMRGELKALLRERVNVGVSERYLTSGGVDVDELLRQQRTGGKSKTGHEFLGSVQGLDL